jgi:integral membrane protein (TIGR01906 family)
LIAAATALVLLGGCILLFLNPIYVAFEQGRTGVPALTGYTPAQVDAVTGAILGDLVLWRSGFDVTLNGSPVLKPSEIQHMLDVRGVFAGLYALAAGALLVLVVAFRRARGTEARAATWRAVASGARGLALVIAVVGVFTIFAFDAAFEVFHRLFFAAGSFSFDPRTDKLVQLFPDAFWSETSTLVGATIIAVAILVWWVARSRAAANAAFAARSAGAAA